MAIKNLTTRLAERGKIKIGIKGEAKVSGQGKEFKQPRKLDHIIITTTQRDEAGRFLADKALMDKLATEDCPRLQSGLPKLTEIPIRLLYHDPDVNFATRFVCFGGTKLFCSGDGEFASRWNETAQAYEQIPCPCERLSQTFSPAAGRCKHNGTLQVILDGAETVGGVWVFRTTSRNSVENIMASLKLISTVTGGMLAGIPLKLRLTPKTVLIPGTNGQQTIYVMAIEYPGSFDDLRKDGLDRKRAEIDYKINMALLEDQAKKAENIVTLSPEDYQELRDEFAPDMARLQIEGPNGGKPGADLEPPPEAAAGTGPFPELETPEHKEAAAKIQGDLKALQAEVANGLKFPEIMDRIHKQPGFKFEEGLPILSHHPDTPALGKIVKAEWAEGVCTITLDLVPNIKEVSQGLTPADIVKYFGEAGIPIKLAGEEEKPPAPEKKARKTRVKKGEGEGDTTQKAPAGGPPPEAPSPQTAERLLDSTLSPSLAFNILKGEKIQARITPEGQIYYLAEDEARVRAVFPKGKTQAQPPEEKGEEEAPPPEEITFGPGGEAVIKCVHCGMDYLEGTAACPNCGLTQDGGPPPGTESGVECPYCHMDVGQAEGVCPRCNAALPAAAASGPQEEAEAQPTLF